MRAMRMHEYGGTDKIRHDEIDRPAPGPGEVLVKVAATSFNPSEIGLRRGLLAAVIELDLPYVMGWDLSGTVTGTGERVIGRLDGGAAAEFVAAPANLLVRAPKNVPLADAAALPIAGVTAWQAVFEHANVKPGDRVLINGVGAIGRYAIQLARHAGAHVIARTRNVDAARAAGAHEVADPAEPQTAAAHALGDARKPRASSVPAVADARRPVADAGRPVAEPTEPRAADADAVAEPIEPVDVLIHLVPAPPPIGWLRTGGRLVSATTPAAELPDGGIHFVVRNDTADLAALVELVEAGIVTVDVAGRRPLADLPDVHREAEAGRLAGKTVLLA
ncbi:NADP-dependent oxidoreductase [Actinoplanes sp. NPDC051861]|uniref:NADP-dependent oxidoreductase n=1 Tax=Actinoplanes sp. NPDC051861 TaxID=3155170 RepID=UPI003416AAC3